LSATTTSIRPQRDSNSPSSSSTRHRSWRKGQGHRSANRQRLRPMHGAERRPMNHFPEADRIRIVLRQSFHPLVCRAPMLPCRRQGTQGVAPLEFQLHPKARQLLNMVEDRDRRSSGPMPRPPHRRQAPPSPPRFSLGTSAQPDRRSHQLDCSQPKKPRAKMARAYPKPNLQRVIILCRRTSVYKPSASKHCRTCTVS